MTQTIQEHAGVLVVERCWCGIQHAVPQSLLNNHLRQMENGADRTPIYCPLGHKWFRANKTETQLKLERTERELQRERQARDQTKAELRETKRSLTAEKAAKTRLKNRVAKGVCPCCKRSFVALRRHMQTQHPEFAGEGEK